jgi:hypothetical protein
LQPLFKNTLFLVKYGALWSEKLLIIEKILQWVESGIIYKDIINSRTQVLLNLAQKSTIWQKLQTV